MTGDVFFSVCLDNELKNLHTYCIEMLPMYCKCTTNEYYCQPVTQQEAAYVP